MIPIFISVHDQELILKLEENNIFRNIPDYKYLFLGMNPVDKLSHLKEKIIVTRELADNIEYDKCLFDYTGWYALIKNNLINNEHVIIVHYDCFLYKDFYKKIDKAFKENKDYFISFQPNLMLSDSFIPEKYAKTAIRLMNEVFDIDICAKIDIAINNGDKYWPGGGSFACSKEWLTKYVEWIEKIHSEIIKDPMSSHNVERTMKFFNIIFDVKEKYIPEVMKHIYNGAHDQQYEPEDVVKRRHEEFKRFLNGELFNDFCFAKYNREYLKLLRYTIEQLLLRI